MFRLPAFARGLETADPEEPFGRIKSTNKFSKSSAGMEFPLFSNKFKESAGSARTRLSKNSVNHSIFQGVKADGVPVRNRKREGGGPAAGGGVELLHDSAGGSGVVVG